MCCGRLTTCAHSKGWACHGHSKAKPRTSGRAFNLPQPFPYRAILFGWTQGWEISVIIDVGRRLASSDGLGCLMQRRNLLLSCSSQNLWQ